MRTLLAFAAAAGLAFLAARALMSPRAPEDAVAAASERETRTGAPREDAQASPTALPGAGEPWSPPQERPNLRALKVADIPAPGRERTPEEAAQAAAVDAAARAPRLGGGGFAGGGAAAGSAPVYRAGSPAPTQPEGASAGEPSARGAAPEGGAGASSPRKAPGAPPARDPAVADEAEAWTGRAGRLLDEAKGLGAGRTRPGDPPRLDLSNHPIGRQLLLDQKINSGVRGAMAKLAASGRPVTQEEREEATAAVLAEHGVTPEPEEVSRQLALAEAPAAPPPTPTALAQTLREVEAQRPPPEEARRIAQEAERPRPRLDPPPRSALQAYDRARGALEKAEATWRVKPHHVLGIMGVETAWGQNTGNSNVMRALQGIRDGTRPGTAKHEQAVRDIAALIRLEHAGELGGHTAANIRGSYAGAIGVSQFLPSSWEAYARSPTGAKRDPFDMNVGAYSTAHYLYAHKYNRSVDGAILSYNRAQWYVDKVNAMSDRVKSVLPDRAAPPAR